MQRYKIFFKVIRCTSNQSDIFFSAIEAFNILFRVDFILIKDCLNRKLHSSLN